MAQQLPEHKQDTVEVVRVSSYYLSIQRVFYLHLTRVLGVDSEEGELFVAGVDVEPSLTKVELMAQELQETIKHYSRVRLVGEVLGVHVGYHHYNQTVRTDAS